MRAALVSPGAVLAPRDSGGRTDYLRQRVALLAKLMIVVDLFFLVMGNTHRVVFLGIGSVSELFGVALLVNVGILAFQGSVLIAVRRKTMEAPTLAVIDGALVLGTLGGYGFQATYMTFARVHRLDITILLVTFIVLSSRAVIVPSTPRTTLAIGVVGVLPAIAFGHWDGALRGVAASTTAFSTIWCIGAVGLTTFTSSVIYGLRESVKQAQEVGQYVIERKLGAGGMGEVYLAQHTMLRRPTAVKLLPPELAGVNTVARFEREVRQTSLLTHPNTVAIYDYGRTREGVFYYAMEYLDGMDLQRTVEEQGPLEPSRVVHVLAQITGALAEAHGRGLVHRDMKPANVVLCDRGGVPDTVKVLDFGLVKDTAGAAADPTKTDVNALIGTPAYMSPEAIASPERVDARSDLYAVGAIGYYLLTGEEVFAGSSIVSICVSHIQERPVRPSERAGKSLPADLEALVLRCLEKDPAARPESAIALRRALLACNIPTWAPEGGVT